MLENIILLNKLFTLVNIHMHIYVHIYCHVGVYRIPLNLAFALSDNYMTSTPKKKQKTIKKTDKCEQEVNDANSDW